MPWKPSLKQYPHPRRSLSEHLWSHELPAGWESHCEYSHAGRECSKSCVGMHSLTLKNRPTSTTCWAHTPFLDEGIPSPICRGVREIIFIECKCSPESQDAPAPLISRTQLTRTFLGSLVLGSITRQKAYRGFPLLSSSTISSQPSSLWGRNRSEWRS